PSCRTNRHPRRDHGGVAGEWPRLRDGMHQRLARRLHHRPDERSCHGRLEDTPEARRRILDVYAPGWSELLDAVGDSTPRHGHGRRSRRGQSVRGRVTLDETLRAVHRLISRHASNGPLTTRLVEAHGPRPVWLWEDP